MRTIITLSLVMMSTAAVAQQAAPIAPAATVVATAKPKPKMICRTDPEIGSLFTKKTCMTAEQWDRNAREGRAELERSTSTMSGKVGG